MDDLIKNKEKVFMQKFVSAEEERLFKQKLKEEIKRNQREKINKIHENSRKLSDLQEILKEEYERNKQKQLLKNVKNQTQRLRESIATHRKIIRQLIEQESKLIRKPRKSISKADRLPYLRKARKNFLESVKLSDSEEEDIELSFPNYFLAHNIRAAKLKSLTPYPL